MQSFLSLHECSNACERLNLGPLVYLQWEPTNKNDKSNKSPDSDQSSLPDETEVMHGLHSSPDIQVQPNLTTGHLQPIVSRGAAVLNRRGALEVSIEILLKNPSPHVD